MEFMSLTQMHHRSLEDPYLPPGFRFHPTDEELVYYLTRKVLFSNFRISAISEVDLNKCEPWDLPAKAALGEKEWYFYTLRDRKYPTGMRTNRATEAGYWKATGKDRNILSSRSSCLVGMKKTLVFYRGRAPKGVKSNWIMHEYRLDGETSELNRNLKLPKDSEWVICRIFQKLPGGKKAPKDAISKESSQAAAHHTSLPPLRDDSPRVTVTEEAGAVVESETSQEDHVPSFSENSYTVRRAAPVLQHQQPPGAVEINALKPPGFFVPQPSLPAIDSYSLSGSSLAKSISRPEFSAQLQQQAGLVTPGDINSLKALDQFSRALAGPFSVATKGGIRSCKVEPIAHGSITSFRPPEMSSAGWLNQSQHQQHQLPGMGNLQLQLQNFPAESAALNELASVGGVPNTVYRAAPSSSSAEMDSLWSY